MNDPRVSFEVHRFNAIKEALLRDDPDNLDERTLADTVEGLTDLHELLAAIVRGALEDETMAALLKIRMAEMSDRLDRFQNRAERRRALVRDAMLEADIKQIAKEDFSASLRKAPPHVVVIDEALIPEPYFELRRHVLKAELRAALKDGAQIAGAVLSNPGMSLTVKTR